MADDEDMSRRMRLLAGLQTMSSAVELPPADKAFNAAIDQQLKGSKSAQLVKKFLARGR